MCKTSEELFNLTKFAVDQQKKHNWTSTHKICVIKWIMLHAKYCFEIWLQIERLNNKVSRFNDLKADWGKVVLG